MSIGWWRREDGIGSGKFICYKIVKMHEGSGPMIKLVEMGTMCHNLMWKFLALENDTTYYWRANKKAGC